MKKLLTVIALGGLVHLTGCVSWNTGPAKYSSIDPAPTKTPPAGKCLVCIHRPKARAGWAVTSDIWDSGVLIGRMGPGNSIAYVCDSGQHYFLNNSLAVKSAVEAALVADQTYDLWIDPGSHFAPTLKLTPVKPGSRERTEVSEWTTKHLWMALDPSAAEHEREQRETVQQLLQEFISGPRKAKLQHLTAEDHR